MPSDVKPISPRAWTIYERIAKRANGLAQLEFPPPLTQNDILACFPMAIAEEIDRLERNLR